MFSEALWIKEDEMTKIILPDGDAAPHLPPFKKWMFFSSAKDPWSRVAILIPSKYLLFASLLWLLLWLSMSKACD